MQTGTQPPQIERKRRKTLRKRWIEAQIRFRAHRGTVAPHVGRALLAMFLPFVEWFGIPSPFGVAWLAALRPRGADWIFPALGGVASLLLRLLWGVETDVWQYAGMALLLPPLAAGRPAKERNMAILSGVCLLPRAIALFFCADWLGGSLALASALLAAGCALWFRRALDVLRHARHVQALRDNACVALLLTAVISGCGYMRFGSVNLGLTVGAGLTILVAGSSGVLGGTLCGTLVAVGLTLGGHSCLLLPCYALGGLVCGLWRGKGNPLKGCLLFLAGQWLGFYLTPAGSPPLPIFSALIGCAAFLATRSRLQELTRALCLACVPSQAGVEDSFVQVQLERWENAMLRLTEAFPQPTAIISHTTPEGPLAEALCTGCPERVACLERAESDTARILAEIYAAPQTDREALDAQLRSLRAHGCVRVHQASDALASARQKERERLSRLGRARYQREMTVTHLGAMAHTLQRIRRLTHGETMADLQAGYQISKSLRDMRFPAQLSYARRVDGHLLAALDTEGYFSGKQLQRLLEHLAQEMPMFVSKQTKTRLELEEAPLYTVSLGVACVSAQQGAGGETVSGDSVCARAAGCGRYWLLLSDGMGHGEAARQQSAQTIRLMMDCLDAGYSRTQAISAVNGMMLLASDEDRFATVDLFELSLWSGEVCSEKLGACGSYLVRGDHVRRMEGASLPLGILEEVTPTSQRLRMHSGDILVAISDGVSDAFAEEEELESAILRCLCVQPQRMADALLREAILHSGGSPADDMTAVVLLLYDQRRSQPMNNEADASS